MLGIDGAFPFASAPPRRGRSSFAATRLRSRGTAHAFVLEVALACAPGTDVAAAQQAERSLAARLADLLPETQLSLIVQAVPMDPRPT